MAQGERQNGNGFDIPLGRPDNTSSIGAIGRLPQTASYERAKFFVPEVVTNMAEVIHVMGNVVDFPFREEVTRVSGRMIVKNELLQPFAQYYPNYIETIIPLEGTSAGLDDCMLLYVGHNHSLRIADNEKTQAQLRNAAQIFSAARKPLEPRTAFYTRPLHDEERTSNKMREAYYELYKPFGWTMEEIEQLLENPNNIIRAAFGSRDTLLGSALAELITIPLFIDGKLVYFKIAEITEAATSPLARGLNLYGYVSEDLMITLAQEENINLVFGETNLDASGVLKVAARQGRTPAFATAEKYGVAHATHLPQHVTISQGVENETRPENYRYNNLLTAWLTHNQLMETYYEQFR